MSLIQDFADASFIITGYRPGCVLINNEPHTQSLIVCPDRLITPWEVTSPDELNEGNLATVLNLQPEVVLLGTGDLLIFPKAEIMTLFSQHKIGLETMSTDAACRTYGILVTEGRRTVAALIFPG